MTRYVPTLLLLFDTHRSEHLVFHFTLVTATYLHLIILLPVTFDSPNTPSKGMLDVGLRGTAHRSLPDIVYKYFYLSEMD